jgi:hypothetical protein
VHNVLPIALVVLTLVIQGGAGLLSVRLENRIAKYVEQTYPDLLVAAGKQPAAPQADGVPVEQKLMFSPPRPLRKADPILDRWCKPMWSCSPPRQPRPRWFWWWG